ncbi:type II secretion system protein [Marmoricola sp. RAF53]|uniref:type II secretion system protein n=1 Tax=Marmoricola sp. RAF53 TaxID=3233059 RepID=UPI003F9A27F0
MHVNTRKLTQERGDEGVTLVELVITVAIVGIIVAALTGVIVGFLKTSTATASRITESHDVQFAAAYWQRDVASTGIRSTTYDSSPSVHMYPLQQSVAANGNTGITPGCSMPAGTTTFVTLGWSNYTTSSATDTPTTVTVAYATKPSGTRYELVRVRCTGSAQDSVVTVARNLTGTPTVSCPGGCNGSASSVPDIVTMTITTNDPDDPGAVNYSATLTGERRNT